MRERALLVGVITALTVVAAVAYVVTTEKTYQATADVLVSPIPADDPTLPALGLVTETQDPTVAVETAAQLIDNDAVAARTQKKLSSSESVTQIQDDVQVSPIGSSNVIAVTASQPTPENAADLANAYAAAGIAERNAALRQRIEALLPSLRSRAANSSPTSVSAQSLGAEVAQLESLKVSGDPTIKVENQAQPPTSPSWPRPVLTIGLALLAGLVLGIGIAYAIHNFDPRLRREEQLRARYRLPILARIPKERANDHRPLSWDELSADSIHQFRTLRSTLTVPRRNGEVTRSFLVTGAAAAEGKTTSAISLATALARAGAQVLLIEADLHRPAIGSALHLSTERGVISVMLGATELTEAAIDSPDVEGLHLLLADHVLPGAEEVFSIPAVERLVEEAKRHYDFVIVDAPPLNEVVEGLPFAREVEDVLILVRMGKTRLSAIKELAELLATNDVRPTGFVVVGAPRQNRDYYYQQPKAATAGLDEDKVRRSLRL
jgi:receptor protein-tyrosine kinase